MSAVFVQRASHDDFFSADFSFRGNGFLWKIIHGVFGSAVHFKCMRNNIFVQFLFAPCILFFFYFHFLLFATILSNDSPCLLMVLTTVQDGTEKKEKR